jgi:Na+/H+ antiporter NhaD/arsenite permease-like protein
VNTIEWIAAGLFSVALLHTFSTKFFVRMANRRPDHAGVWHLLAEVEVVFGLWAMVLVVLMAILLGTHAATGYLDSRDFTEPMFVFAIMVVAGSRAILQLARSIVNQIARIVPLSGGMCFQFVALSFVPLLGSLITEPAAMTLAAMMLRDRVYGAKVSDSLRYATLGVLFVNVSIGGTLTSFAAPPVLMVASTWGWDSWHMLSNFGWRAAVAVVVNALVTTLIFRKELAPLPRSAGPAGPPLPTWMIVLHVGFLAAVVVSSHHPPVFMGVLLFFLGIATAYPQFQSRLILREGLLVAFFLAGLVVLGGQQRWWLEPLLRSMDASTVFFGATALTAVTDNAALTYLASTVSGLSDEFKYAIVAGAVTGGGLTVIANAPNPAGFAILRGKFKGDAINPLRLLLAATPPTLISIVTFWLI